MIGTEMDLEVCPTGTARMMRACEGVFSEEARMMDRSKKMWQTRKKTRAKRAWAIVVAVVVALAMGAGCSDDAVGTNNGGQNNPRNGVPDTSLDGLSSTDGGDTTPDAADTTAAPDTGDSGATDATDSSAATDTVDDVTDAADMSDTTDTANTADTADTAPDASPVPKGCTATATVGVTYPLDTNGPDGQLYARAAFDGDGVWLSYTRRESAGAGDEDVYAVRILCDGTIGVGPVKVNTTGAGVRDYDPSVDVRDEKVYVAWITEDPSTGNKSISYRTYNVDGTPIMSAPADVTPQNADGSAISELIWETDVAGLPDGGAIVVASYSSEESDYGFQVIVQQVDENGNRVGAPVNPYSNKMADQTTPMVAADTLTKVWVSWTRSEGFSGPHDVVYRSIDMTNPQQATPTKVASNQTTNPSAPAPFGEPLADSGEVFVAHTSAAYGARLASLGTATASDIQASPSGGFHLRPSIATGPGGGMLAWYEANSTPIANKVIVQPFSYNASTGVSAGSTLTIPLSNPNDAARPPYGPSIVHTGGGIYFVSWNEGPSAGEARLMGRFIQP
jgi:hypothetical protein